MLYNIKRNLHPADFYAQRSKEVTIRPPASVSLSNIENASISRMHTITTTEWPTDCGLPAKITDSGKSLNTPTMRRGDN